MSNIKLDLSQVKHLKSDKNTTTLQHKHGHTITLMHNALSEASQKQLAALAAMNKDEQEPDARGEAQADKEAGIALADGGSISKGDHDTSYLKGIVNAVGEGDKPKVSPTPGPTPNKGKYKSSATGDEYAKGGAVKMAEGGDPSIPDPQPMQLTTQDPDIVAKQQAQELDSSVAQQPTPQSVDMQALKDMYNQKIASAGAATSADDMFGPNGEAPKNPVNPTVWGQVENSGDAQKLASQQLTERGKIAASNDAVRQQQSEHDKAVAQNIVNAKLGIPLVADPGAPAPQEQPQAPVGDQLPPQPMQQQAAKSRAQQVDSRDPEAMLSAGYDKQMAGISAQAEAQGKLGEAQAALYQQQADAQQQAQDHYKTAYDGLEQERQHMIEDVKNGYIDPDQYWKGVKDPATGETHGGHSKIMAGIGMILAGMDAGINGGGNKALQFLQYQMDKNIEAQSKNLQAKDNLLANNLHQFGNLKDAVMMTRIMQNDILQHKLSMAAAQSASPMAKAAAQQAQGQLQMQTAPMFQQFAMRRAMMNLANNGNAQPGALEHMLGYMRVMNPEMAKEMETRLVPGIGANGSSAMADRPVPEDTIKQIIAYKNVNDLMNRSLAFSQAHRGTLSPALRAEADAIHGQLLASIKQAQHDGVYKQSEGEFITGQMGGSSASMLANFSSVPKVKVLQQIKQQEYTNLLKAYNIKGAALPQAASGSNHAAASAWANANMNSKDPQTAAKAAKILQLVGK